MKYYETTEHKNLCIAVNVSSALGMAFNLMPHTWAENIFGFGNDDYSKHIILYLETKELAYDYDGEKFPFTNKEWLIFKGIAAANGLEILELINRKEG